MDLAARGGGQRRSWGAQEEDEIEKSNLAEGQPGLLSGFSSGRKNPKTTYIREQRE